MAFIGNLEASKVRSALSPSRQTVFALLILSALTGCIALPSTPTGPWKEELKDTLTGKSMEDARSALGEPTQVIELPDVSYYFYIGKGTQKYLILAHPGLSLIMLSAGEVMMPVHPKEEEISQCLMLEVRDEKIVRAAIKSTGGIYDLTDHKVCPPLFWKMGEYRQIIARADQFEQSKLAREAEEGNVEAALAIARKYRELSFLKTIAAGGNRGAVFLLAEEFEDTELLRQLASSGDVEAATMLAFRHKDKAPLYVLAKKGIVEAAAAVAENFGEHDMLKTLADGGNPQAAAAYRRIICGHISSPEERADRPSFPDGVVQACSRNTLSH